MMWGQYLSTEASRRLETGPLGVWSAAARAQLPLLQRIVRCLSSCGVVQLVVVVDAGMANVILGNQEGLNKALEPDLSDALLSHTGHRTMFSADTNSPYWRLIRKGTAPAFISANIK